MSKHTSPDPSELDSLAEDARALLAATADVAGEKVAEARKRVAAALDKGREIYDRAKDKAIEGAQATDEAIREHPYEAIAIAFGVGAIVGFLASRRSSRKRD